MRHRLMSFTGIAGIAVFAIIAWGQESRGTIQGRVMDPSGAAVPMAEVSAVNLSTNVIIRTTTAANGTYNIPFLLPGTYRLEAAATGFRTLVRGGIELRIADRLQVDLEMQVGELGESITVTAEAPLLDTASANLGQVIDSKRVAELPNSDGSPLALTFLSPGAVYAYGGGRSSAVQAPNFMQNAISVSNINGTPRGSTEFTMDGVPNTQNSMSDAGSGVLNSPPADMVQEFKMETAFDASVGHTSGSIVNFTLKTGGNAFHGTALWCNRDPEWQANTFIANRGGQPRPSFYYDRWSATLTGPIWIPKLYDGRNQTFFSFGYEELHFGNPQAAYTSTVPTATQLTGDFSQLLTVGSNYQIYDPATIRPAPNGRFVALPFADNIIPSSRISPIGLAIAKLYPAPNNPAALADGTNNFAILSSRQPRTYRNYTGRLDQKLSEKHRIYVRYSDVFRKDGPYRKYWDSPASGNNYVGPARQAVVDDVYTITPSVLMNIRYGFNRYEGAHVPDKVGASPASLGFPAATVAQLTQIGTWLPTVSVSGLAAFAGEGVDSNMSQSHSLFVNFTRQWRAHNFKFGSDVRAFQNNIAAPGAAAGTFTFATNYTRGPYDNSTSSPSGIGQGLAALLLGLPTSGSIARNDTQALTSTYWAAFFHDNWRVNRKLTMELGLRWEYEGPVTDRYNRSVNGFDASYIQPIEAAARAAYAANPDAALPVDQLKVRGGLLFAGVDGRKRELWNKVWWNLAPRVGLAYKVQRDTVLRAGFGVYPIQIGLPGKNWAIQTGYSQSTALVPTLDNGQTFIATIAHPFPSGIEPAVGNALKQRTYLGQGISFYDPSARTPYSMRWSMNVQRILPGQVLSEVGYVGNKALKLRTSHSMNALPNQYLSTSAMRDQATINYLSANVKNPLAGLLPGSSLDSSNVARSRLLVPYPHFSSVTIHEHQGYMWYNSLQARVERRFAKGFTAMGAYTFSKTLEATGYLNAGDPTPSQWISSFDRPHNLTFSGLFDLPFGRGKKFFSDTHAAVDAIIGGWTIGSVYLLVSGAPLGFGNALLTGSIKDIPLPKKQRTLDRWFNTDAFVRVPAQQLSSNLITLSPLLACVRADYENLLNLSVLKKFRYRERYYIELRGEAINAPNHPYAFLAPNSTPTSSAFGRVTAIGGTARTVQAMLKIGF